MNINPDYVLNSFRTPSPIDAETATLLGQIDGEEKKDFAAPFSQTRYSFDRGAIRLHLGDDFEFPVNAHFRRQFSLSLAPGLNQYGEFLLENEEAELFCRNHNELLRNQPADRKGMIRTIKNGMPQHARAWLSDAYQRIDDDLMFNAAMPVIAEHRSQFRTLGGQRTDERTFLKIVTREPVLTIRDRRFFAGFIMSNSEVGNGTMSFSAFFTDSFCENGCIFSKMRVADLRMVHRGSRLRTDFGELMDDRLTAAKEAELTEAIGRAARIACSSQHHNEVARLIQEAEERKLTGDPVEVLEGVGKRLKLTESEIKQLSVHYRPEEPNALGVNSAITRVAQESTSYERRIELEKAGGDILTMPQKTWDAVAALA